MKIKQTLAELSQQFGVPHEPLGARNCQKGRWVFGADSGTEAAETATDVKRLHANPPRDYVARAARVLLQSERVAITVNAVAGAL